MSQLASHVSAPGPAADERANILIVDDLSDKLLVFKTILEELDQNLIMVRSGSEALREVLAREFAVILLDVNMPDIDGIETAALIRKYKRSAHTPIIFITAYADEMQTAQGYSLGAVDYILSPIIPEVLRTKVKVFVELFKAQQRTRQLAEERVALARAEAARSAAEETTRRSTFLARASRELGASLDIGQTVRGLLQLAVPQMGQLCVALVAASEGDDGGAGVNERLLMCAASHAGAGAPVALGRGELPEALSRPLRQVLAEGQPLDVDLTSAAAELDADARDWPRDLRAALVAPLRAGERLVGAFMLATRAPFPAFSPPDVALLLELAGRAAMAIDNASLYQSLQREIARSREAEERLQDANRRKDEFLAMLSHELRNPLAPIRTAAEVIRRVAPPDPTLRLARDVVDRQVSHLVRLVDELLDVSRISEGKISLKKESIELGQVIKHSIETARPLVDSRKQKLIVSLPFMPVRLHGDYARLAQVIGNLLTNASKYTQEGGRIEISASASDGEALIVVKDNGTGIDPRLLPRVFELFVQGERSLDRSQGGLGVGLTLVQRIVELHQGRVEAISEGVNRGAEFRVILPCVASVQQDTGTTAPASAAPLAGQGRRVLVVDDNADAADSIAAYLRLEGHVVKTATDGQQALACTTVFAPQVVVLDIGLPGLSGYDVARRLRQDPATRDALLIAVTGYGQKEDRMRATEAGFDCHYVKPADPRDIQATIQRGRAAAIEHGTEPGRNSA
jgi:signal transduction histidine kinase/DNA-binding response OmpR family regulator